MRYIGKSFLLIKEMMKSPGAFIQVLKRLYRLFILSAEEPATFAKLLNTVPASWKAYRFSTSYTDIGNKKNNDDQLQSNPLWDYFQSHREGHGIWKWIHYFEIYHRHFEKFIGKEINVVEIGIYSGGSLEMWQSYFGEKSHIYGVDIEDACKVYENDHVSVFIGDQANRAFWKDFKEKVGKVDIVIDDGGHTPEQQQITLEELLPHIKPGGVYLCEDVHRVFNRFSAYATGLVNELNRKVTMPGLTVQSKVSPFQSSIYSIHFYSYIVVIEKHLVSPDKLLAPKHGTEWQPFL